jgi:hypothetical protein
MPTLIAPDLTTTIHDYVHAWNASNTQDRSQALFQSFASDGTYIDPHAGVLQGRDAMQHLIDQFRTKFAHPMEATGHIDFHHNIFRLPWRLGDSTTGILSQGLFVGQLNADHKICQLLVFLDKNSGLDF